MVKILLKRIYEEPSEADGYRILLDRLWEVFQGRYGMEIKQNPDFIPFLREIEKHPVVTFLTAAKDVQHSHLPILKEVIEDFEKNKS